MMAAKKTNEHPRSVLGLLPLSPAPDHDHGPMFGLALHAHHALATGDPAMVDELRKEQLALELEKIKAVCAAQHVAAIHQQGADIFHKFVQHHTLLKEASREQPYADYLTEFLHHSLSGMATDLFAVMNVGVGNIMDVTRVPLYQPEPKKRRRGWW